MCGPRLVPLGAAGAVLTILLCAVYCSQLHARCNYFAYAKWQGPGCVNCPPVASGNCFYIDTATPDCPEGFVENVEYDFYGLNGKLYDT